MDESEIPSYRNDEGIEYLAIFSLDRNERETVSDLLSERARNRPDAELEQDFDSEFDYLSYEDSDIRILSNREDRSIGFRVKNNASTDDLDDLIEIIEGRTPQEVAFYDPESEEAKIVPEYWIELDEML